MYDGYVQGSFMYYPCYVGKQPVAWKEYGVKYWLTFSQTTKFKRLQTERIFKLNENGRKFSKDVKKKKKTVVKGEIARYE